MLKNVFLAAMPIFSMAAMAQVPGLLLEGTFTKMPLVEKVIFMYALGDRQIQDTVLVQGGRYSYRKSLETPVLANVVFRGSEPIRQWNGLGIKSYNFPVYLQPGSMKLETVDSVQNTRVLGSQAHLDHFELEAAKKPYIEKMTAFHKAYGNADRRSDTLAMERAEYQSDSVEHLMQMNVLGPFLDKHISSPLAAEVFGAYMDAESDSNRLKALFTRLPETARNSENGRRLSKLLMGHIRTAIGCLAPPFTQKDSLGNNVFLTSFRGKYVLVDFWASWCVPCRRESPNVVKAFARFGGGRFTILSVSLDEEQASWVQAIRKDGLAWTHVCDLKGWENEVARTYGIEGIPDNFLLDPEGRIVARGLHGAALIRKLEEVLR